MPGFVEGSASISLTDPSLQWCLDYAAQVGIDSLDVIFHSIHQWVAICGIPIYQAELTSFGWWREPFIHAEKFIVGGLDIDARRSDAWEHVHDIERRAVNHAKRLEKARLKREPWDAENKEILADKFARHVEPGDAELLMSLES